MRKTRVVNKAIITIVILNMISFLSHSQNFTFFEVENLSNLSKENYFRPQINVYAESFKSNPKLGLYFFALANENWGQAYGGIIVKPLSWLSIKLGAGLEVNSNPYRFNITMLVMKNRFYFIQIYEYGGSGFWYHIVANYEVCDRNYLGVIAKRYYGLGIDYEHKLKSIPLKFGISPLYDFEDDNFKFLLVCRYNL